MSDVAATQPTPEQIIAGFGDGMNPIDRIAAISKAFLPGAGMVVVGVLPNGRSFTYSPDLMPRQMVSLLYAALDETASTMPFLRVTFGDALGEASTHADAATVANAFTTIGFDSVVTDTHGAFDAKTGIYTVPEDGLYDLSLGFRLADGDLSGLSYGVGIGTANADSPAFDWHVGAPKRQAASTRSIVKLAKGDAIRAFYYLDGRTPSYTAAELTVLRLR